MERYLPRNLLVILISWRSVQPCLDSAWWAAAGGWWLTWKRWGGTEHIRMRQAQSGKAWGICRHSAGTPQERRPRHPLNSRRHNAEETQRECCPHLAWVARA